MQYVIIPDNQAPTHKDSANKTYRVIEYADNLHVQTGSPIVTVLTGYAALTSVEKAVYAAAVRKAAAIAHANKAYADALAAGIVVGSLTLAALESDQNAFLQGVVMLMAAKANGILGTTLISAVLGRTVSDKAGASHDMTIDAYITMVMAYGLALGTLQGVRNAAIAKA